MPRKKSEIPIEKISFNLETDKVKWLDSKIKLPYPKTRTDVIKQIIYDAYENKKEK